MAFLLYKITHRDSGRGYVGVTTKTVPHRWSCHVAQSTQKGVTNALARAIRKYGREAFDIQHIATAFDRGGMLELERLLIIQENTRPPCGFNLTAGGEGVFDPSEETRQRMSARQKGKPKSEA